MIIGNLSEGCTTKPHATSVSLLESSAKSALQNFTQPTCHYWKLQRRVHYKTSRNQRVIIGNLSEECTTKPHVTISRAIIENLKEECTIKSHTANVPLSETSLKSALQNVHQRTRHYCNLSKGCTAKGLSPIPHLAKTPLKFSVCVLCYTHAWRSRFVAYPFLCKYDDFVWAYPFLYKYPLCYKYDGFVWAYPFLYKYPLCYKYDDFVWAYPFLYKYPLCYNYDDLVWAYPFLYKYPLCY